MPGSPLDIVLCRYQYNALNHTIGWAPRGVPNIQRFYRKDRLATEIEAAAKYSFFEHDHHVLAQRRQTGSTVDTTLLATDQQRSVLNALDATPLNRFAYSPYGHRPHENGLLSLLGFNGERPDPVTGHYHLGHGYRQFNPVLMRFNSPDSWSPFGKGGLNPYAYCAGDSVNRADPTGHVYDRFMTLLQSRPKTNTFNESQKNILNAAVKDLLFSTYEKQGGTTKILENSTLKNRNPDHFYFDAVVLAAEESIENEINSYYRKLKTLNTKSEIIGAAKSAMWSTSLTADAVYDIATLLAENPLNIGKVKGIHKRVDDFHSYPFAPHSANERIAKLTEDPGYIRPWVYRHNWHTPDDPPLSETANIRQ